MKEQFGGVSITRLRSLTLRFESFEKNPAHNMKRHLRELSNLIVELYELGHMLTEEQKL